ncbi:MAG: hypothetical protein HYY61_04500, partial [Deltaproteobacteria bacterium]|nr:hypothetical protein [Deltaproteobacteria bacterium]
MIQKLFSSTCFGVVLIAVSMVVQANDESSFVLFKNKTIDTSIKSSKALHSSMATTSPNDRSVIALSHQKVYLVVQFKGPMTQDTKKKVQKIGAELLSYIPHYAFIIRLSQKFSPLLLNMQAVKWVGDYEPELKLSSALTRNDAANEEQMMSLHIKLFSGEKSGVLKSVIQKYSGTILYDKKDIVKVLVKRKAIQDISYIEGVEWIEEAKNPVLLNTFMNEDVEENLEKSQADVDPYQEITGFESGVRRLQLQNAYAAGLTGEGQIVGVADTGLDLGDVNGQMSDDFKT